MTVVHATGYPTTARDMLDRLQADREFYIRTIVTDNYPAVLEKFRYNLQADQPQLVDTPEKLARQVLWWDRSQGREVVEPVLDVPFRNAAGSAVLREALAMGDEIIRTSGGAKAYSGSNDASEDAGSEAGGFIGGMLAGGIAGGIGSIINGIAGITNGRASIASNERIQEEALARQHALELERSERNAKLIKYGIIVGAIVLVIVAFVVFRSKPAPVPVPAA